MEEVKILDHGYIKLIESWGSDERIIEAARMSTNKGFLGWGPNLCPQCKHSEIPGTVWRNLLTKEVTPDEPDVTLDAGIYEMTQCPKCKGNGTVPGDEKLLKYLYDHRHDTPFEMAGLVIEVQAPLMVFREWHRHRTQSYNELSARYTPMPDVNYIPSVERCLMVSSTNKQAGAITDGLTHDAALSWLEMLADLYEHGEDVYQAGLHIGIPKELARLPVSVGRYSRMRASANLRNVLGFLTLRSEKNLGAQWEIRQYANALGDIVGNLFPRTMDLFVNGSR